MVEGVDRFGRYFRRKGWIEEGVEEEAGREVREAQSLVGHEEEKDGVLGSDGKKGKVDRAWNISEGGVRLVVEFATAWAVTKALIVPRVVLCVWGTPGFARGVIVPMTRWVGKVVGKGKKTSSSAGGKGVGETGGGVGMTGRGGGDGKSTGV